MRRCRLLGLLAAVALSARAAHATPIVMASQTSLVAGETTTLDLAFDAGTDLYAGFLLVFEATAQLELVSFAPSESSDVAWSADLAAGVFSINRSLSVDESGRFELGRLTVRAGADGAALSLGTRSSYVTPSFNEIFFHTDPLASTGAGAPATPIVPPPPPPPPRWYASGCGVFEMSYPAGDSGGAALAISLEMAGVSQQFDLRGALVADSTDSFHVDPSQVGPAPCMVTHMIAAEASPADLQTLVPEPATATALLAGLAALAWRRRVALFRATRASACPETRPRERE